MKKNGSPAKKTAKEPKFVVRAERAMKRAAQNVKKQNRALGLPLLVWGDKKAENKPKRATRRAVQVA